MLIAALKILPFFTTMLGGVVAVRAHGRLHLIYGVAGGVMLGLVGFHLLPEIGETVSPVYAGVPLPFLLMIAAFLVMFALAEMIGPHPAGDDAGGEHHHPHVGLIGASALVIHSFMDGLAIGVGFTVSDAMGIAILVAVLAHDFSDGMATVAIMRRHGNSPGRTWTLMLAGAVAPVAGAFIGGALQLSETWALGYAGFFAGTLIYFATRDMIPGARQSGTALTALSTITVGVVGMWLLAAAGV